MAMQPLRRLLALMLLASIHVLAADNTPLSFDFVEKDLEENNGFGIAMAGRPLWHFATNRGQKTCLPTSAITADHKQTQPLEPELFPFAGAGCPEPGVPVGSMNDSVSFPTYYTVNNCGENEIRVVYNLFFQKDGFTKIYLSPCNGHRYDWERIIVIWRRAWSGWIRDTLLTSFHQGYHSHSWSDIETFSHSDPNRTSGTNLEGPKIYVGWGKHAMFVDRKTSWTDCFSQGCAREYRSNDWWFLPKEKDLVHAGSGSEVGEMMDAWEWGRADSYPTAVERKVCKADGSLKGPECFGRSACEEMEGLGDRWDVETSQHAERNGWTKDDLVDDGKGFCTDGQFGRICREDVGELRGEGRMDL